MEIQAEKIRNYILKHLADHSTDIVALTTRHFNVTRTTVHRHLTTLLKQGFILKSGTTRSIKYFLKDSLNRHLTYKNPLLHSEFQILKEDFIDIFKKFETSIEDICYYGFTEILNNALEHSKCTEINIYTQYENERLIICIKDNGIGIFNNIKTHFHLADMRESVFELSKGKITTDPSNHTGEGVFFTSRAFDLFEIFANQLHYIRNNQEKDWALETSSEFEIGTMIRMSIHKSTKIQLVELFRQYQNPENLTFDRTEILVELSRLSDEPFISRSQAKRVVVGLDKFRRVVLDFSGVRLVGQGFVDEIFRIFVREHPNIVLTYTNANPDVLFMIKRCLASISNN